MVNIKKLYPSILLLRSTQERLLIFSHLYPLPFCLLSYFSTSLYNQLVSLPWSAYGLGHFIGVALITLLCIVTYYSFIEYIYGLTTLPVVVEIDSSHTCFIFIARVVLWINWWRLQDENSTTKFVTAFRPIPLLWISGVHTTTLSPTHRWLHLTHQTFLYPKHISFSMKCVSYLIKERILNPDA